MKQNYGIFVDVSTIHLLILVNKNKYEIFAVDCIQIKDLDNLSVIFTFDCLQVSNQMRFLHSALLQSKWRIRKNLCLGA